MWLLAPLIVHAKLQVYAMIFLAARLVKGIFAAFYSILTALSQTSQWPGVLKSGTKSEQFLEIIHARFQVNAAIFAAARLENGIFEAFYSILTT